MPTYEYKCTLCNQVQEVFHSIKEEPEIKCKSCNGNCKRMVSGGTGFIIRGGGTRSFKSKFASKKRGDNLPTPSESAQELASKKAKEIKPKHDPNNPYSQFI